MYCSIQSKDSACGSHPALQGYQETGEQRAADNYDHCQPIFHLVHGRQVLATSSDMSGPQQHRLEDATVMPLALKCSRNRSLFARNAAWPAVVDDDLLHPDFNSSMAEYSQLFQLANHDAVAQQPDFHFQDCAEMPAPRSTSHHCVPSPTITHLPQSMFDPSSGACSYGYGISSFNSGPPPYGPVEQMEQPLFSDCESYSDTTNSTPAPKMCEDDEMDKPYARLIYEALMQAPGRRMMLKDIYGWFLRHTTKPQESGTNGWQNSIRHNLSMNQAFENDKGDGSGQGHPRKANSVWLLTEHAIKYGVQSTTRYRKTGTAKKGIGRAPAIQRQRSGARGGRAARRSAARVKKQEEQSRITQQTSPLPANASVVQSPPGVVYDDSPDMSSICSLRPATPTDEDLLPPLYRFAPTSHAFQLFSAPAKDERPSSLTGDMSFNEYTDYADIDLDTNMLYKFETE